MKVAIITSGTPDNKKGAFNAVHQRSKHLLKQGIEVDVFIVRSYPTLLIETLKRKKYKKINKDDFFIYDSVKYINLWLSFSLIDYLFLQKLNRLGPVFIKFAKKISQKFSTYDLISAHSWEPGIIALYVKKVYGVPFAVTWHGSDIHSMPSKNQHLKKIIIQICLDASLVFFVSKQLQKDAKAIGIERESHILYNGVDRDKFKPYSAEKKLALQRQHNINAKINIGFIGGLVPVKNVQQLPSIFKKIDGSVENVKFYFIGDGNLRPLISRQCIQYDLKVDFLGDRPVEEMPGLINCFDVVVLPSINEGLPLIVLECQSCGVPIITSKVGGIPEVLNEEQMVPHGPDFVERFANRVLANLKKNDHIINISPEFGWERTAIKEATLYQELWRHKITQL